ncbi:MAG TPA: ferric reductase-like transmembrane domain-containing protein [Rugosimonospora sp.]|nr:ferric reductase-like transmembrane domain-containing protein [Rugosimonospora sp.]
MTNALWYLSRGTGAVSLILLTVVVVLGIAGRSGQPAFGLPRFAVTTVHRNASLMAVVLLAIHVTTLMFDPYAQLNLVDAVLPFVGSYRPFWLGLGTLGLDLIVTLIVTSLLRHRLGLRTWRAVHWLAYAAWPVALLHGLGTGTDSHTLWLRAIAGTCAAGVAAGLAWRLAPGFGRARATVQHKHRQRKQMEYAR